MYHFRKNEQAMNQQKMLFIDRDGTLIEEPADKQIDSVDKLNFMPGVFEALTTLKEAGYTFVMVSNQDGLGTSSFAEKDFQIAQEMMLKIFASQNIMFDSVRICPHFENEKCTCRKPQVGLILDYLKTQKIDLAQSYVIGDRITDIQLAENMGIKGLQIGAPNLTTWSDIAKRILITPRQAMVKRKTKETDIMVSVDLENQKNTQINTGIAFFDHMLQQLAAHGGFGLKATVKGDYEVDDHHTVEDTALAIGEAIRKALGDKRGIGRYGFVLPMDEALAQVSIDICGRPYFDFQGKFNREKVGELSTECVPHFFRSFSQALGAALHMKMDGENTHHMVEALFKACGRSLGQAIIKNGQTLPSTKGIL